MVLVTHLDFSSSLCLLPHKQLSILPSYGIPCQLQHSLISKVLISSDCQNILARVALNFLAPLRLGVCGLGLSISSLVQDPHEVSSLPSRKAALQKHLLCKTRSWSTAPSQPMMTAKRKKHCNKAPGVWGYLLMQHNLTCLGSFTFPLSNLNLLTWFRLWHKITNLFSFLFFFLIAVSSLSISSHLWVKHLKIYQIYDYCWCLEFLFLTPISWAKTIERKSDFFTEQWATPS